MEHTKKMVLVPQETLTKLQSARRLEQTPTTRVVQSLDADMRDLLERQDLSDEDKIKLYHQTLHRYIHLNRQRTAPLTMTLETKKENVHSPKLEPMASAGDEPPKSEKKDRSDGTPEAKLRFRDEPEEEEEESFNLSGLFAEAPHLKPTASQKPRKGKPTTSRRSSARLKPKWTPY